jgi:hypothetical protein
MYRHDLRWNSLIDNLVFNELNTAEDTLRLNVHYRFLSAFVHPLSDQHQLLYGQQSGDGVTYDHFASELILLYIVAFASYELEGLLLAMTRPPSVEVGGRGAQEHRLAQARHLAAHLWFLGERPTGYDRISEANQRLWANPSDPLRPPKSPQELDDSEVRYYRNPLRRLVALHRHANEIFGYKYASLWPRADFTR